MDKKEKKGFIDLSEALKILKTTPPTLYRWLREGKLHGIKVGRQWRFTSDDIDRFLHGKPPKVESSAEYGPVLTVLDEKISELGGEYEQDEDEQPQEAFFKRLMLISRLVRASNIHLEPLENGSRLRLRSDGELVELTDLPPDIHKEIVTYCKTLACCNVQETNLPQDGRITLNENDTEKQIAVNFLPASYGESMVMTIRQEPAAVKLENLPFTNEQRDQIESALHSGYGMIVCTGSHGSGKTTTQFALLQELNTPSRKLIAVEEPGGYTRADITQIRIRPQSGMGYAEMLRAVKRADPDVVLVGIIDSPQTAIECINLSGSGHLLIGSMQTADTVSTIEHLCDIGIEPYKICENVRIVVAQRLIRRLCPHCAESIDEPVNNSSYPQAQAALKECAIDWGCITKNWKKAVGCPHCRNLGYIGRKCIYEVLAPNKEFRAAIMQNASGEVLRQIAIGNGMLTLQAGAALLAANGEVSLTEAISVTGVM